MLVFNTTLYMINNYYIHGAFHKWGYPSSLDGLFHGQSHLEMDDDWGYPYFRKPPHECLILGGWDYSLLTRLQSPDVEVQRGPEGDPRTRGPSARAPVRRLGGRKNLAANEDWELFIQNGWFLLGKIPSTRMNYGI